MPDTEVKVLFTADASQAKTAFAEMQAQGEKLSRALETTGRGPSAVRSWAEENQAALAAYNTGLVETTGATNELSEATERASGSFGNMGGMMSRMLLHLAAYEAVSFAVKETTALWKTEMDFSKQEAVMRNLYGDTKEVAQGFAQLRAELGEDPKKVTEFEQVMRALDDTGTRTFSDLASEAKKLTEVSDDYGLSAKGVAAQIEKIGDSGRITTKELQELNREFRGAFADQLADAKKLDDQIIKITGEIKEQEKAARDAKGAQREWQSEAKGAEREAEKTGKGVEGARAKEEAARGALIQAQMYGPGRFETNAPALQARYREAVAERQQAEYADRQAQARALQAQAAKPAGGAADTLQALKDELAALKSRRELEQWTGSMDVRGRIEGLPTSQQQARLAQAPLEGAANFANAVGDRLNTGMAPILTPMGENLKDISAGMKALLNVFQGGH